MGVADSALDATLLGLVEMGAANSEMHTLYAVVVGDGALRALAKATGGGSFIGRTTRRAIHFTRRIWKTRTV